MTLHDKIEYPNLKEPLTFNMECSLIERAATPKDMDVWRVALTSDYPGQMDLTYRMGVGHRAGYKQRMSVYDWERSKPKPPSIASVLYCIGMDYQTARDLPRDEADAMDAYASEFGWEGDKPSELLRTIRALNKQADDLRKLLRHTGIDPDHFADWCAGLES